MLTAIWTALLSTMIRILTTIATKEVFEKIILLSAEKLVKKSSTTYDDDFFKIVKEALEKHE